MASFGTISVNGESGPRLWRVSVAVELPPGVSGELVRRLAAVERRVGGLRVSGKSGRVGALVLALEQLAEVVDPTEPHAHLRRRRRQPNRRRKGEQS